MRLIDADKILEKLSKMIDYCKKDTSVRGLTALFQVGDAIMDCPTIDTETLPIVQELRQQIENEKNKKVKIRYDDSIMTIRQICDRLRRVEQQLKKVTAERDRVMEWISVKDKLPNEEDDVILLVKEIEHYGRYKEKREIHHWVFTGWRIDDKWATTYCHGFKYIDDENEEHPYCEHIVTHWMPLPEPPEDI